MKMSNDQNFDLTFCLARAKNVAKRGFRFIPLSTHYLNNGSTDFNHRGLKER